MRTFVPETRHQITTDNGESLQRRERLCAGRSIRLFQRTRAKQANVTVGSPMEREVHHTCTTLFGAEVRLRACANSILITYSP